MPSLTIGPIGGRFVRDEALGELAGPAAVGVGGGGGAVGDGIAESDDHAGFCGGEDVDTGEEIPGFRGFRAFDRGRCGEIAGAGNVGCVQAGEMVRRVVHVAGNVDADGEIGERRNVEIDWIADNFSALRNDGGSLAAEGERAVGTCDDRGIFIAQRDVRRAYVKSAVAKGIRELDAHADVRRCSSARSCAPSGYRRMAALGIAAADCPVRRRPERRVDEVSLEKQCAHFGERQPTSQPSAPARQRLP